MNAILEFFRKAWPYIQEGAPLVFRLWMMILLTYITLKMFSDDVLDKVVNIDMVAIVLAVIAIIAPVVKGYLGKNK